MKVGKAGLAGCRQRGLIHEGHHQHRTGIGINHNGGKQPASIELADGLRPLGEVIQAAMWLARGLFPARA